MLGKCSNFWERRFGTLNEIIGCRKQIFIKPWWPKMFSVFESIILHAFRVSRPMRIASYFQRKSGRAVSFAQRKERGVTFSDRSKEVIATYEWGPGAENRLPDARWRRNWGLNCFQCVSGGFNFICSRSWQWPSPSMPQLAWSSWENFLSLHWLPSLVSSLASRSA